jgi:hypothetical protein
VHEPFESQQLAFVVRAVGVVEKTAKEARPAVVVLGLNAPMDETVADANATVVDDVGFGGAVIAVVGYLAAGRLASCTVRDSVDCLEVDLDYGYDAAGCCSKQQHY